MIKVKGKTFTFTGKDHKWLIRESSRIDLSPQDFFTAVMWEAILVYLRKEADKNESK